MKKSKAISFLLSLSLLASVAISGAMALPAYAANEPNEGMKISKTATENPDGTYTITLDAYATGEKISTEVTKDVPTDIVLVLDQSGSMAENDFPSVGQTTYVAYAGNNIRNSSLYNRRHNQDRENNKNLYYQLPDGSYATVSVTRTQGESSYQYTECPQSWWNDGWDSNNYYSNRNNLYVKVGDEYQKVTLNRTGGWREGYTYTYTFPDGSTYVSERISTEPGNFDGKGPLYVRSETQGDYTYTYTCTDADGNTINIGTSTGADTQFTDATLYQRNTTNGGNISRLLALKNAVTQFENSVATKAAGKDGMLGTDDDVNHRVAVVGFASKSGYGDNTELLSISGTNSGSVGVAYNDISDQNLKDVLQSMDNTNGQTMVSNAINALATNGATRADLGLDMAQRILAANPVPEGEKRNRVVVFFTDGQPTSSNGFEMSVANSAITNARNIKNAGTDVYSIGIFNGADATSAGNQNGNTTEKSNWFMQRVSSNNGTPRNPSYYLSASDAGTLNNIFQQISDQIQTGGSAIDLGSEAVIKDIIAPQFELPEGTTAGDITLETYSYTGENQWEENSDAMGAKATVDGDQVSVTGFDFKENWCGTETTNGTETYRGNKLVISFPVEVKDGFLGGNGVYTNTSAGVYANSNAENPLFIYERPQVDVKIKDITVTAPDKNVYLMGDLTAEQIKSGATVKAGNVDIDLSDTAENYGLESWQNEYVNIAVTYRDKDGNTVTDLNDLREDTTYTVSVKVSPKTPGQATEKTGEGEGKINVFQPELTYKDSDVWYGDAAPTDYADNKVSDTVWKHGETVSTGEGVTMVGTAPTLDLTYTPEAGAFGGTETNQYINTTEDIPVAVGVKIGENDVKEYTTINHTKCSEDEEIPENANFLLHVKTCELTINKNFSGEQPKPGETFVFTVTNEQGNKIPVNVEVVMTGAGTKTIKGLPVGSYTVREDAGKSGWSWRYEGNQTGSAALNQRNSTGTVTITNKRSNDHWLDGNTWAKNLFGFNKTPERP